MTTYTTSLRLWQGTPGDPAIRNAWGTFLNTDFSLIDSSITGKSIVNIAGLTTYSLTTGNGTADQSRELMQDYTGALAADCTVTLPGVQKVGWARNSTTGGHNVLLKSGGASSATLPPDSRWYLYWANGTIMSIMNVGFGAANFGAAISVTGNVSSTGIVSATGGVTSGGNISTTANISAANVTAGGSVVTGSIIGPLSFTGVATFNTGVIGLSTANFAGQVFALGFVSTSDRRRKSDIKPIEPEVGELWALSSNPVTYLLDGDVRGAGFIAQEQLSTPAGRFVVSHDYDGLPNDPNVPDGKALALNYNNHDAFLVAALKSAFRKIDDLSSRLEALEQE